MPFSTMGSPPVSEVKDLEYSSLEEILRQAFDQASSGKGRERHANGRPFDRQPIMETSRMVGLGFPAGQVMKKAQEACGMADRGQLHEAERELLGVIVYAAAAVLLVREKIACRS